MKLRAFPVSLLSLIALGAPIAPPAAAAGPTVVVVGSATTVRPHARPAGSPPARIFAARNEFESFQVVAEAGTKPLRGLQIHLAHRLSRPGGSIPARDVTIYREAYYDVVHASDLEGAKGRWPDPLIPAVDPFYREHRNAYPVTVPAGENRVAWIDVLVPKGAHPGRYDGMLSVTAQGLSVNVPVHLTVLRFTLPSTASLASAFGMGWNAECLAHTGGNCFGNEARQWQLKSLYVRAALEDRSTIYYPAFQPPSGNGSPGSESANFRRYILPLLQGRSPAGLWTAVRLPGARLTSIQMDSEPSQLRDWKREARRGHFSDRAFLYACDEPNQDSSAWQGCRAAIHKAHSIWPGLPALITSTLRTAKRFGAASLIDILVPIVNEMHDKPGFSSYGGDQRGKYDSWLASQRRNRLWMYTSCESHGCAGDPGTNPYWAGWPSYVIDQPPTEARAMGWLSFEYRSTGDLYFDTDYDLPTAWSDQFSFGGNGDGTLFYPGKTSIIGGKHDIPIDSIRLKRIRDGREDYEYLRFLAGHGKGAGAMKIARGLFPKMYRTNQPQSELSAARRELADLIAAITGGPKP